MDFSHFSVKAHIVRKHYEKWLVPCVGWSVCWDFCLCVRVQSVRSTCRRMGERCGTLLSFPRSTTSSSTPCCQPIRTWYSCTWTTQEVSINYDWYCVSIQWLLLLAAVSFLYSASVCVCVCVCSAQTLVWEPYMCQTTEEQCSPSPWSAIFTLPQEVTLTSQPLLHSEASTWLVYSRRVSQHIVGVCARVCVCITA